MSGLAGKNEMIDHFCFMAVLLITLIINYSPEGMFCLELAWLPGLPDYTFAHCKQSKHGEGLGAEYGVY